MDNRHAMVGLGLDFRNFPALVCGRGGSAPRDVGSGCGGGWVLFFTLVTAESR